VGKKSLAKAFASTLDQNPLNIKIVLDGQPCQIELCYKTFWTRTFRFPKEFRDDFIKNADGYLLVYAPDEMYSLLDQHQTNFYINNLKHRDSNVAKYFKLLVCNKSDLYDVTVNNTPNKRFQKQNSVCVSRQDGAEAAKRMELDLVEVSSVEPYKNIHHMFRILIRGLRRQDPDLK
jgi:GTPase SAR1 family protein